MYTQNDLKENTDRNLKEHEGLKVSKGYITVSKRMSCYYAVAAMKAVSKRER